MVDCGEFVVACVVVKNAPFFGIVSREAVRWRRGQGRQITETADSPRE